MGKPQRRRKVHYGDTHLQRRRRTRNDLDLIDDDLKTKSEELINQNVDLEKAHYKTKVHKRRLKALELEPYTIEESERAAGHGAYSKPIKQKMGTQPSKEEFASGKRVKLEVVPEKEKRKWKINWWKLHLKHFRVDVEIITAKLIESSRTMGSTEDKSEDV